MFLPSQSSQHSYLFITNNSLWSISKQWSYGIPHPLIETGRVHNSHSLQGKGCVNGSHLLNRYVNGSHTFDGYVNGSHTFDSYVNGSHLLNGSVNDSHPRDGCVNGSHPLNGCKRLPCTRWLCQWLPSTLWLCQWLPPTQWLSKTPTHSMVVNDSHPLNCCQWLPSTRREGLCVSNVFFISLFFSVHIVVLLILFTIL